MLLGYTVVRTCASPRKINLVHQTIFPHERMGFGNENYLLAQFFLLFRLVVIEFFSNYPKHTCLFAWDDDDVVPGMIGGVCQLM